MRGLKVLLTSEGSHARELLKALRGLTCEASQRSTGFPDKGIFFWHMQISAKKSNASVGMALFLNMSHHTLPSNNNKCTMICTMHTEF